MRRRQPVTWTLTLTLLGLVLWATPLHCFTPYHVRIKQTKLLSDLRNGKITSHLHENEYYSEHGVLLEGKLPARESEEQGLLPNVTTTDIKRPRKNEPILPDDFEALTGNSGKNNKKKGQDKKSKNKSKNRRRKRGIVISDESKYWTNGIVPYVWDAAVTEEKKNEFRYGMELIEKHTCVRFVPWNETTKSLYGLANNGRLNFIKSKDCWSYLGNEYEYFQGAQDISCCGTATCVHELGHGLGLIHEHTHYDNKGWIRKNWFNQQADLMFAYAEIHEGEGRFDQFDLSSPMHYNVKSSTKALTLLFPELKISMHFLYFMRFISETYRCQEHNCSSFSMECHNGGFVTLVKGKCACYCPHGLHPDTGCTTVRTKVEKWTFPGGSYAFPAPREGCPTGHGFETAFVTHRYPVASKDRAGFQDSTFEAGEVNTTLCVHQSPYDNAFKWPRGHYCLYRVGVCPEGMGFREPYYYLKDPKTSGLYNVSGEGPVIARDEDTGITYFYFCYYYPVSGSPDPVPLPVCEDSQEDCPSQAHSGQCLTSANVASACPYSCDTCPGVTNETQPCVDTDTDCEHKLCSTYSDSKREACTFTCGLCPGSCGGIIRLTRSDPVREITSPNFPDPYNNHQLCYWQITGPPDTTLLLTFSSFDVEGNFSECEDKLEINHARIGYEGLYYCGVDMWETIRSIYNEMELRLYTDFQNAHVGFNATVRLALPEDHCFNKSQLGKDYRGDVNYTRDWKPCVPWNETKHCRHHGYAPSDLLDDLDGNYCRNPGNGIRPWCYTDSQCNRNYCDVCFLETPFDTATDCGPANCTDNTVETRQKCARTCAHALPARTKPRPYTEVTCDAPSVPADAASGYNLKSVYSVGENVSFTCNDNVNIFRLTTCMADGQWSPLGYVCGGCPEGWIYHDFSCFLESDTDMIYDDAKAYCQSLQAHVAEARTEEDMVFLIDLKDDGHKQWLGLTKNLSSSFVWHDGTQPAWVKWASATYVTGDCSVLQPTLYWAATSCSKLYNFVCQRPARVSSVCGNFLPGL
ncbi:bone morphogenetic protein 1-like isoform X2 [Babylonia areolata]|uniref:bone morphogenetic protein 1-like isoform X2 n=1 Tax=Babylonia areolata TaxID=304850 RepID=UPI003FD1DD93